MSKEEEEPAEGEEGEKEIIPKIELTLDKIKEGLALLKRTPDGASYAYSTLTIEEPDPPIEVMGDAIKDYKSLLNVSFKQN